ncbi:hypothetical protein ACFX12_036627 [Malus domestica]
MVKMLLQRDFTSASSLVSYMFSFLSLSFSSIISDDALIGDELEDITCSSLEFDGEIIGFAVGTAQIDATCGGRRVNFSTLYFAEKSLLDYPKAIVQ